MAYALDSSKRKFHRLLESISYGAASPSSPARSVGTGVESKRTNVSTNSPADTRPSKRVHLGVSPLPVNVSSSSSSPNETSPIIRLSNKAPRQTSQSRKMLPFCPSDRDQFLLRLQTFSKSIVNWSPKPDSINEVEWARRGWFLAAKETISCVGCSKRLVIGYKEDEMEYAEDECLSYMEQEKLREEARKALAASYASMLSEGHYDHCPWKRRACDASIYRIPTIHPVQVISSLQTRYESLLKIHDKLPTNITLPDSLDLHAIYEKFISRPYPPSAAHPPILGVEGSLGSEDDIKQKAFTFALCGWYADTTKRPLEDITQCADCFRRLGLWMWRPRPGQGATDSEALLNKLDVTQQHRNYCPWSNATTQNEGAPQNDYDEHRLCGWEVISRTVENASRFSAGVTTPANDQSERRTRIDTAEQERLQNADDSPCARKQTERKDSSPQRPPPPVPEWAMLSSRQGSMVAPSTERSPSQDTTPHRPNTGRSGYTTSDSSSIMVDEKMIRDTKDKERLSKLKKLKQVFTVKTPRKGKVVNII